MLRERLDLFEFSEKEKDFLKNACDIIEKSNIKYPVVYAGSGGDVEHGIIFGNHIIFLDSHMPEAIVSEIKERLRKVTKFKCNQEMKEIEGLKFSAWIFDFKIFNEKIKLEYWNVDATKILPEKIGVYFIKVPLPKEANVGYLCSEESLKKALDRVVVGGYFIERECPLKKPEKFGFIHVISGELSGLSVKNAIGNLYRKVSEIV